TQSDPNSERERNHAGRMRKDEAKLSGKSGLRNVNRAHSAESKQPENKIGTQEGYGKPPPPPPPGPIAHGQKNMSAYSQPPIKEDGVWIINEFLNSLFGNEGG